ncbi:MULTISPECIES: hypothetical protein [Mycobacterium]|uniref:Lipoprotein n=1 Tax=Mycobacterium kiyosense TaxID=2871094 RepID=A0AA37PWV8_9MYCO|nr:MULTISPECIES: hypothetical protein [Mycobacterium]BDB42475.1 hypothetical protein IWGMT90018_29210 [Mycobacterium kiyosense]BDE14262.1 hypothetical protein MKCMC460_31220 [Mycobacterium sp. 20KCMC460]GLB81522.1 hypothetical protein SRL2020028_07780 [Mycobacterium kiyosense]GLB90119.1 hypothetical protein SRL2020130_29360 [Mycobacterium kiyosense]GLB93715.1 hypothetical protein SRL2020226_04910 [Mycobacterium kiyosense]
MGSKENARTAVRFGAAALLAAGWVASAGVAAADPEPSPPPAPAGPPAGPAPAGSPAPAGAPKTTIDHDGTYLVGKDIVPGVYSTAGPVGNGTCYWKRTGNPDGALVDNAMTKKPQIVQIEPTDKAFKTSGCQPWQPSTEAPPQEASPAQVQGTLGILNGLLGGAGPRPSN